MRSGLKEDAEEIEDEVNEAWRRLEFNIDENYQYVPKSKIFKMVSHFVYYGFAMPVLYCLTKVFYDLKIEGKENILKLDSAAVSVSNHVLVLDCAMVGLALEDKKVFYTVLESSFKIPIVRKLIKLLRAIPIPTENRNKPYFMKAIDDILQTGDVVHFYPEASLCNYYNKLRRFKNGAFRFAVKNNVPVLPMVFTFRRPKGLRRIFKNKSDVTLTVLEPIKISKTSKDVKEQIEILKNEVYKNMKDTIDSKKVGQ